jgi:hypothetical protein
MIAVGTVHQRVRYEISMMVKIHIVVFSVMTLCNLIGGFQHFRGIYFEGGSCMFLQKYAGIHLPDCTMSRN